jgi:hypothetical protein
MPHLIKALLRSFALVFLASSCFNNPVIRDLKTTEEFKTRYSQVFKFIKAHMKDGRVYILDTWKVDASNNVVHGYGKFLDVNRRLIDERVKKQVGDDPLTDGFHVSMNDVALIETNDVGRTHNGALTVVTGITAGVAALCAINPKACFGSCPTFYVVNGDSTELMAEGFSTSVAPSLERDDIDMLFNAAGAPDFQMLVTNEALETHCINSADLLVFPRVKGEGVYATEDGTFYRTGQPLHPRTFLTQSGDMIAKVTHPDKVEYFSTTDSVNINSREWIDFSFDVPAKGNYGIVIGKRQTLLTTFLMYQGLAYMGNTVTWWMAEMERGKTKKRPGIFEVLGGIDIYRNDGKNRIAVGSLNETGPIAVDYNVVPVGQYDEGVNHLSMRLNKGLWRIDYVALVELKDLISPVVVGPRGVDIVSGTDSTALEKLLRNDGQYLVTYPGDSYRLYYTLPFTSSTVFLKSRGYYLEWVREEWIREQNLRKFAMMMKRPEKYLRRAAGQYKSLEPSMEETFWNSRYAKR